MRKFVVHASLVVIATSIGFYAANYSHRYIGGRKYKETAIYEPAASGHLTPVARSLKTTVTPKVVVPGDYFEGNKSESHLKVELEQRIVKTTKQLNERAAHLDERMKLIGTLVADTPEKNVAVIEFSKTRVQESYKEGDVLSNLRIVKIERNQISIENSLGEWKLAMMRSLPATSHGTVSQDSITIAQVTSDIPERNLENIYFYDRNSINQNTPSGRRSVYHLDRKAIESKLEDVDAVLKQIVIQPVTNRGNPAGFRIAPVEKGSIFEELGLNNADVIVGVNNEVISNPNQAALLLQRIKAGGEVTIQVKGKRRNRIIQLEII